jgi:cytochrome c nitrite reductase small subunit
MTHILKNLLTLQFIAAAWRAPAFAMCGVATGLGLFVFHISRADSYLSDAPETCMNCHVMTTEYVTWRHSSHANVATCNDCHVPHNNVINQYAFKARDGLWHATVFTMRWEPQVIRLSRAAIPVVENNCRRCHAQVIENVSLAMAGTSGQQCWDCHREVPHGTVRGLSATPGVFQPQLPEAAAPNQQPKLGGRPIR